MKRRKAALLAVLFAASLMLAGGCTQARELKDMDIIEGMGVDLTDDGQYLATYQIFQSQSETSGEKVKILQAAGATLFDAGRNVTRQTGKRLYYANQSAFVIGSALARQGLAPIEEFFTRNHELRIGQRIFMAEGRADDVLTAQGPDGIIPASTLELASRNEQYTGKIIDMQGIEMFERISTGTDAVMLPVVIHRTYTPSGNVTQSQASLSPSSSQSSGSQSSQGQGGGQGNGSSTAGVPRSSESESSGGGSSGGAETQHQVLEVERTAIFNKDQKLVGFLNANQTRGYQWTSSGRVDGTLILTMPDGAKVSIEIQNNTGSLTVSQNAFTFNIKVDALLTEQVGAPKNVFSLDYREQLKELIAKQVKSDVSEAVNTAFFGAQSDIFRIGSNYFRFRTDQWRTLSKDWPASGKNLKCNVNANVNLSVSG